MNIVDKPIAELIHPEYNPRQITEKEFADIRKSIEEFGIVEPAVVNCAPGRENIIIGGNQRVRIAVEMGMQFFPCMIVNIADEHKEKELCVRLNKNQASFDFDKLANEFDPADLIAWGFDDASVGLDPTAKKKKKGKKIVECPNCGEEFET